MPDANQSPRTYMSSEQSAEVRGGDRWSHRATGITVEILHGGTQVRWRNENGGIGKDSIESFLERFKPVPDLMADLEASLTGEERYEPPSHQRGAGDGTCTPADRCAICLCALSENGLCVDTLCPGSREDDDDYYARIARER